MRLSDLHDFERGVKTGSVVAEQAGVAEAAPAEAPAEAPAKKDKEPWGVVRSTTPTGIDIYYQAGPKRMYTLASETIRPTEVPSPSAVLEVLEKGGLSWWGMKVGVEGLATLIERGDVQIHDEPRITQTTDEIVDLLKAAKLTVNHVKGAAADRGTNVHGALELYAETGIFPDPDAYPETERGYVRGLISFLKDTQPEVEHSELMVASTVGGFAGRFDLVAKLSGTQYASRCYPKRASLVDTLQPGGRWLLDLKTSKGVYPSYHLQLAAYEGGMEESGYGDVDETGVVRVTADGKYELVPGRASFEDFLAVLEVYHVIRRLEGKS